MKQIQLAIRNTFYSFPLQLLILLMKKHHLLVIIWFMLFGGIFRLFGNHYGYPFLYLDPEYLGNVNFFSFLIVGFALGGFIMAWHISFYVLNSFRFNFLASISSPFITFCLNNSVVPLTFIGCYIFQLVKFDISEGLEKGVIFANVLGLVSGALLNTILSSIYFVLFNKDVTKFLKSLKEKTKTKLQEGGINLDILPEKQESNNQWIIETYFSNSFRWKLARNVDHYDPWVIRSVLRQHHYNAFVIILASIITLFTFGSITHNPIFRLPAAASVILLFTVIIVSVTAFTYWFGEWRSVAFVAVIFTLNYLSTFDLFVYRHKLLGMNYEMEAIPYNQETIEAFATESQMQVDINHTKKILDRWKTNMVRKYGEEKPKLVFINTGGGGVKSSYWSMLVLQMADQALEGKLFDHCMLISGASGGMWGVAEYRELYLQQKEGKIDNLYDTIYADYAGKDLLNSIMTSISTNDLFFPWRTREKNGERFRMDRGYAFEQQYNENTNYLLDKKLLDYQESEESAKIPLMIMSPTILNDQRTLYVSTQPVSYLTKPYVRNSKGYLDYIGTDGVEFMSFFEDYGAQNLNFVSALRMQASFPYLFPSVHLPTRPKMKVSDAGLKENYGLGTSTRFYNVFKDWIDENTSGVIFIQIRTDWKFVELEDQEETSIIGETANPFGSIYANFMTEQEYVNDNSLAMIENMSKTDINFIPFAYQPLGDEQEAAMSIHLTQKEKEQMRAALNHPRIKESMVRIKSLLD